MRRQFFNDPGHAHYITFSCYHHRQLLTDDSTRSRLAQAISKARDKYDFRLWAWVIMPEHVHLLLHPQNSYYSISRILQSIKGPVARRVLSDWRDRASPMLSRLKITAGGRTFFRFWQAGGGFDRNLYSLPRILKAIEYIEYNPVRRGLVSVAAKWRWSSAWARAGKIEEILQVDDIEFSDR